MILKAVYNSFCIFLYPFNLVWNIMFGCTLYYPDRGTTVVVIGVLGGSGKTSLAKSICDKTGRKHVSIDDCKFGEAWKRYSEEEFVNNLDDAYFKDDHTAGHVIEGIYIDPKFDKNREVLNDIIHVSGLVVYCSQPKLLSVWRKLFRSFKRYIRVEPQGTAPEKLHNVIDMTKKTYVHYDTLQKRLDMMWKKESIQDKYKYRKISWPFFYNKVVV